MSNYTTRHAALDQKAAALYVEFKALQEEIETSRQHHEGFRRLKKTMFHLEKIARQNGNLPKVERRKSEPRTDLFVRKPVQDVERDARPPKTPPDLFNKQSPPVESRDTEIRNSAPPDLFNRHGKVSTPNPPPTSKKQKAAKDKSRKVVADSNEETDD